MTQTAKAENPEMTQAEKTENPEMTQTAKVENPEMRQTAKAENPEMTRMTKAEKPVSARLGGRRFPQMEDCERIHYLGQPSYNAKANFAVWAESWWDCDSPKEEQNWISQIRAARLPEGTLLSQRITAGGSCETQPTVLNDGSILFLSDGAVRVPPLQSCSLEQRKINEWFVAPQLYIWKEGAVRKLTSMLHGLTDYRVSPDENAIFFTSWIYEGDAPEDMTRERTGAMREAAVSALPYEPVVCEDACFKSDAELGYASRRKRTLWLLDPASGYVRCLLTGNASFHEPFWAPDSQSILYETEDTRPDGAALVFRRLILQNEGRETKDVFFASVTNAARAFEEHGWPQFTADGSRLIFAGVYPDAPYAAPRMLCAIPASGGENITARVLTDYSVSKDGLYPQDYNFVRRGENEREFTVMPDGCCYFISGYQGNTGLFRVSVQTDSPVPQAISGNCVNFHVLAPAGSGHLLTMYSDDVSLPELAILKLPGENDGGRDSALRSPAKSEPEAADSRSLNCTAPCPNTASASAASAKSEPKAADSRSLNCTVPCPNTASASAASTESVPAPPGLRLLTHANPWLDGIQLQHPRELWFDTLDGLDRIQGWVLLPPGREPGKKYPVILYCHGGPTGFYSTALNLEFQALSAAGFGVIYANPRGGTGYGTAHSQDRLAYDGTAMTDLLQFVHEACRRFDCLDISRAGVCGGSYGGYMTAWLASHSGLFRAACAHRPLLNLLMISYSSHSAGGHSRENFESFTDFLLDSLDRSPAAYADQIRIPFQILQSERDANCVPEQAHQFYTAIRDFHPEVPCRLVLYPDSCHGLLAKGPMYLATRHRLDNLEWFRTYL